MKFQDIGAMKIWSYPINLLAKEKSLSRYTLTCYDSKLDREFVGLSLYVHGHDTYF